jgi:hypothetical protein
VAFTASALLGVPDGATMTVPGGRVHLQNDSLCSSRRFSHKAGVPTLRGSGPSLCPAPYRAENPAKFWSGYGGEWAYLVAGVRSVGSDGCQKSGKNGGASRASSENRRINIAMA